AAVKGLVALRKREVVPLLVERMQREQGRILREFADALFELTAQPFRTNASAWAAWLRGEGATFELATPEHVARVRQEQEERRLRQLTNASFFGIRIESHRVIFILDISGSMNEPTRGKYVGQSGDTRMSVAQRELKAAIDALD